MLSTEGEKKPVGPIKIQRKKKTYSCNLMQVRESDGDVEELAAAWGLEGD